MCIVSPWRPLFSICLDMRCTPLQSSSASMAAEHVFGVIKVGQHRISREGESILGFVPKWRPMLVPWTSHFCFDSSKLLLRIGYLTLGL